MSPPLPLCSSLKRTFPEAEIHLVLNEGLSSLYFNHPDVDKVITFSRMQNKSFLLYLQTVWSITHINNYDVIIDMRSTIRTLIFSLCSLKTPYRIGLLKPYTSFFLNYRISFKDKNNLLNRVKQNLMLASPLQKILPIKYSNEFSLYLSEEEKMIYRQYMQNMGICFKYPIMLVGVTTKLNNKRWPKDYMTQIIKYVLSDFPEMQLIFNYTPGEEEQDAREIYADLGCPSAVKIDIKASNLRELMALCANSSFYFGNEGGARHIAQAMGLSSYGIFSLRYPKTKWLPVNSVVAYGISPQDCAPTRMLKRATNKKAFEFVTPKLVYQELYCLLRKI